MRRRRGRAVDLRRVQLSGRTVLLALAVVMALAGGAGETGAAFSGVTSHGGNGFVAAPPCTTVTVTAARDAWMRSDEPDSVHGIGGLYVRSQNRQNRRALVFFDLPSARGCTLVSATLRLNASIAGAGRTIEVVELAGAWTETGVTWAKQPATTGTTASANSSREGANPPQLVLTFS